MRVQTEEWRRFIPGVRIYKGKMTLFYNGERLWDENEGHPLVYDWEEMKSWEVIIVLPGVEVIPWNTFAGCKNLETVVMSDSVTRIENCAFERCESLKFVKFSTNLVYIGMWAFENCKSLTSIFIPPSCTEIGDEAFAYCTKLIILSVPQHTQLLGECVIARTALVEASHFETNRGGYYNDDQNDEVNEWIKNLNQNEEFALHRECASYEPSEDAIYEIIKHRGLLSIHIKDQIGLTAFEYLQKNPFTDIYIDEHKLIKRHVLDLMGEIVT